MDQLIGFAVLTSPLFLIALWVSCQFLQSHGNKRLRKVLISLLAVSKVKSKQCQVSHVSQ